MVRFIHYDNMVHRESFFELNVEYLTWFVETAIRRHNIDLPPITGPNIREYVQTVIDEYTSIHASEGIIYMLDSDGQAVGMGALKRLEDSVGELKRMYIHPEYRGQGYGTALLQKLIAKGRELGYATLRLDTADFMTTAHQMYRSAGFTDIDEYAGSEIPEWYRPYTVFMEKTL